MKLPFVWRSLYNHQKRENATRQTIIDNLSAELKSVRQASGDKDTEISLLRAELAAASKNDKRDPKTGRYVKAD